MSIPRHPAGMLLGCDTSSAQGRLDVPALADAGAAFLYARATDGEHTVDAQWAATAASCARADMPLGAYGVLEPYGPTRARVQAMHFVDLVKGSGATLPPSLDFELARGLSGMAALAAARTWCDVVEDALGRRCVVYTSPYFFELLESYAGHAGDADALALASRPLWVAHYTNDYAHLPRAPRPWHDWTIWQASGDRPRPGRPGSRNFATLPGRPAVDVDIDLFRGTLADLRALGCPAYTTPEPTDA